MGRHFMESVLSVSHSGWEEGCIVTELSGLYRRLGLLEHCTERSVDL